MRRAVSLQTRLTRLLALQILLLVAATLIAAFFVARDNVKQRTEDSIEVGERVVQRVLDDRMELLAGAASVLVRDYGFVEAFATGDAATVVSALANHGDRIGADALMTLSLDGRLTAVVGAALEKGGPFPDEDLLRRARRDGYATAIAPLAGTPYQLILVPVEAPVQIGWACLGFRIHDGVAADMEKLTSLGVHFSSGSGSTATLLASSLTAPQREELAARLATLPDDGHVTHTLQVSGQNLLLRHAALPGSSMMLLLDTSLDAAMAPFYSLYLQLGLIALLSLAIALAASWTMARSVARPLQRLAGVAGDIREGRYDQAIEVREGDGAEATALADSLNHMRAGIAAREERILHQSRHDALTGLPNRAHAEELLGARLAQSQPLLIALIDINRFSEINDRFGHERGDAVLVEIATRLTTQAGNGGITARTGGNEFLLALPCMDETQGDGLADAALQRIAMPLRIGSADIHLSARAGIALAPQHGRDVTRLLRRADLALRDATARTPRVRYTEGREEAHQRELLLARDLVTAIESNQLTLNYQPKTRVSDGALIGVEALARWTHPEQGFVRPDHFIAMAERSGQIGLLTRWVLRTALHQAALWHRAGVDLRTSVNLSALDLVDETLPEFIEKLLRDQQLPPERVCLEVTESTAMQDADIAIAALQRLRALGVTTSIDDFGTGYSSLAQLRRLPLDELKIDKAFVLKLKAESSDAAIVRSTIELAHHMKMKVTAEGVETAEALVLLDAWGCDIAQGFLVSKPLPAETFAQWLATYAPRAPSQW